MSFHEVLFPVGVAYGASGGPKFKTAVFTADSGYEQRTLDWKDVRAEYDVSQTVKRDDARDELSHFFMCRRGMAYGFRFKDWNDYTLRQEVIGQGDGRNTTFQITKRYTSDQGAGESWTYDRKITKIAWGSLAGVTIGDVIATRSNDPTGWSDVVNRPAAYKVDENTGVMTFREAPLGYRYPGTASFAGLGMSGANMIVVDPAGEFFNAACVDFETNTLFLRGSGPYGLRAVNLAAQTETTRSAAAIGFPNTDPVNGRDNQRVSALVTAGDGFVYVVVGGHNRQVLYKLTTGLEIVAANGTASSDQPVAGEVGPVHRLGALSNDGSSILVVGRTISDHTYSVFSSDLEFARAFKPADIAQTSQIGPVCPYFDEGFALTAQTIGGVGLYDDSSNLLTTLGASGASPLWCCWDDGADPGVIVGWTEAGANKAAKYAVNSQSVVWTTLLPGAINVCPMTPVKDELWVVFGASLIQIDTLTGMTATRACAAPFSVIQAYAPALKAVLSNPTTVSNGRLISTDVEGLTLSDPVEVKIGYGEFHVPVRFNTDHLDISYDTYTTSSWSGIELIEVRDWSEIKL